MNYKVISAFAAYLLTALTGYGADGSILTYLEEKATAETVAGLDKQRVVYQDFDPATKETTTTDGFTVKYIGNSKALTGDGCHVNKLVNVVGLANAYIDLQNVVDEDLTNSATIAKGVAVKETVDPLITIRDSKHYYAKGTTAGFRIVGNSGGNSLLKLNVIKTLVIGFYRDGKLVGTAPAAEGQNASALELSLVTLATDGVLTVSAQAPDMFDEISLDRADGVGLELATDMNVKYAFAGKSLTHILNRDWVTQEGGIGNHHDVHHTGGITKYNELTGRKLKIDYALIDNSPVDNIAGYDKFVEDPEEGAPLSAIVALGSKGTAEIHLVDEANPDSEVFPAGTEIGFKIKTNGLLDISAGSGCYIRFFTKDYTTRFEHGHREYAKACDDVTLTAGVLDVEAVEIQKDGQLLSAIAPAAFSGAQLFFGTGLDINLGATYANYAYIREKPEQAHRCNLAYSSNVYLAKDVTSHQIVWNNSLGLPVEFTLVSKPEGSAATVDAATGELTDIDKKGSYVVNLQVQGKGHEDCNGRVVISNNQFEHSNELFAGGCGEPLINGRSEATYMVSDKVYESSGSLISISDLDSPDNIVDSDTDNYSLYVGGLSIADNVRIVGVKRADGGLISDGSESKRVGFVVEESTDALSAKALEFLQIRCYYKAQDGSAAVYSAVIDESNAISAQVIGESKTTKVRYSIEVPAGFMFDEIQLWTSGVLKLSASNIKFYYPFIEESNSPCNSLLGCNGELLGDQATITPMLAGGTDVAQFIDNTSFLIDNDLDTYMTVQTTVGVGAGNKIRVNLGRTIDTSHDIGIILDNKTLLDGVKAGSWLTVRLLNTMPAASGAALYAESTETEVNSFSDWHAVDAKVAGFGDKRVLYVTPSAPFNEIELTPAGIAEVTDTEKFYGICLRGDSDHDGIPDCMDLEDNSDEISTGIDAVTTIDNSLTVAVCGNKATASCPGSRISRLIAFDIDGTAFDSVDGKDAESASIALPSGISVLQVIFENGTARSVKLCVR